MLNGGEDYPQRRLGDKADPMKATPVEVKSEFLLKRDEPGVAAGVVSILGAK